MWELPPLCHLQTCVMLVGSEHYRWVHQGFHIIWPDIQKREQLHQAGLGQRWGVLITLKRWVLYLQNADNMVNTHHVHVKMLWETSSNSWARKIYLHQQDCCPSTTGPLSVCVCVNCSVSASRAPMPHRQKQNHRRIKGGVFNESK